MNARLNQHTQQPDLGAEVELFQVDLSEKGGPVLYLVPDSRGELVPDAIMSLTSQLPDGVTFSRSSIGTYFDQNGVLRTAAVDEPRFDHDPATGEARGLLIEEARTNVLFPSEPTQAGDMKTQGEVSYGAMEGFTSAVIFGDNSVSRYAYMGSDTTPGEELTFSVIIEMDDGSEPEITQSTTSGDFRILSESSSAANSITKQNLGNGRWRVVMQRTATGGTNLSFGIVKYTGQSAKTFKVTAYQLERGTTFATSYIPTTTVAGIRSNDICDDSSFQTTDAFTVTLEYSANHELSSSTGTTGGPLCLNQDGSNSRRFLVYDNFNPVRGYVVSATVGSILANATTIPAYQPIRAAFGVASNDMQLAVDGVLGTPDTDVLVETYNRMAIGRSSASHASFLNGWVKKIAYYDTRLSDSTLEALSAGTELPVISFGGQVYTPFPIAVEGFEWKAGQAPPRPRLAISNLNHAFTGYVLTYDHMVGAKVTRIVTFEDFLDGGDSPDGEAHYPPDIFRVNRKLLHNREMVEFELASRLEQQGKKLPGRLALRDYCSLKYRDGSSGTFDYSQATCPYVGAAMFDEENNPVVNEEEDICPRLLPSCRLRFPDPQEVPFGGFPGMLKTRLLR